MALDIKCVRIDQKHVRLSSPVAGVFLVEPGILDIKTLTWFSVCFLRPDEDVQNCLKIMIQMLKSGRRKLVDIAQRFLESLKKSKSLDWKVLLANF